LADSAEFYFKAIERASSIESFASVRSLSLVCAWADTLVIPVAKIAHRPSKIDTVARFINVLLISLYGFAGRTNAQLAAAVPTDIPGPQLVLKFQTTEDCRAALAFQASAAVALFEATSRNAFCAPAC
jgi:hypothetical protein